jgi:hypothetical protein
VVLGIVVVVVGRAVVVGACVVGGAIVTWVVGGTVACEAGGMVGALVDGGALVELVDAVALAVVEVLCGRVVVDAAVVEVELATASVPEVLPVVVFEPFEPQAAATVARPIASPSTTSHPRRRVMAPYTAGHRASVRRRRGIRQ